MKRDRNTNCFKYIITHKTSCSWYTGWWGCWRGGWSWSERGGLWVERGRGTWLRERHPTLPFSKKNNCHLEKFQSLRNTTWRKEVCGSGRGHLPRTHDGSLGKGWQLLNCQLSQTHQWTFRFLFGGNQKPWIWLFQWLFLRGTLWVIVIPMSPKNWPTLRVACGEANI